MDLARKPAAAPPVEECGLSATEARARLTADGPNALPEVRRRGGWRLLLDVLSEPMFLLLVACGAIYMALGDRHEAAMLLGFVVVVMAISFAQQRRTERSLAALRDLSSPRALVLRDGQPRRVPGRDLVRGDLVLLAEGDRIPADLRLVRSSNLMVDESLLTGESAPVARHAPAADGAAAGGGAEVFAGTLVTQGSARAVVVATGAASALGRIGASLAGIADETTPIERETRRIVTRVALVGLGVAALLALTYALRLGDVLQGLLAGLTLAMAIIPEELPVVLTLFLALGAWRLAREQVLARSIPAVELLGATTVLCVDKTGTLTANRMTVSRLWSPEASHDAAAVEPLPDALHGLLEYALLASHRDGFDPMERAIAEAAHRLLAGTEHLHRDWTLVDDYPLSGELLAMSRVWQSPDRQERLIAAKGAPEAVVDLCHLDPARQALIGAAVQAMAAAGQRVLGVAQARFASEPLPDHQHAFDFDFLGLVGLEDPVRPEVPAAIAQCQAAGIRVVMVTGDHPATAASVARQAGLTGTQKEPRLVTGAALDTASDAALQAELADTTVFCRVRPEQKLRLVQAWRDRGEVVAMSGDGVNDAPALKAAHIGVAMGARGTDVAREAAALVLLDDSFAALVTAVRHGRRIFANLRKAIVFVVAVHVPIVGLALLPALAGGPMLLLPVHVMFLQLIIDPACAVVFEAEPEEAGAMRAPPRDPAQTLFDAGVLARGAWQGAGLLVLLLAVHALAQHAALADAVLRALCFVALVLGNLGLIHANRRWSRTEQRDRAEGNRWFGVIAVATTAALVAATTIPEVATLFAFAPPPPATLGWAVGAGVLALAWFEAVNRIFARRGR